MSKFFMEGPLILGRGGFNGGQRGDLMLPTNVVYQYVLSPSLKRPIVCVCVRGGVGVI